MTDDSDTGGATILSIAITLPDPVSYVRKVLDQLWIFEREWKDAQVRIGIRKDGAPPNYLIETVMDLETGQPMTVGVFDGRTHRPMTPKQEEQFGAWESTPVPISEVAALIGELRGFKPNTVHLMIWMAFLRSMGGRGLSVRRRRGNLLIFRLTPRLLRLQPRLGRRS